jgi:uncharacterized RDD family membrane protein YckC
LAAPVKVAEASAHLGTASASKPALSLEPAQGGELSLEPLDGPAPAAQSDPSPYRPPATVVDDEDTPGRRGEARYAGFWVRYSANVLDTLILFVITFVIAIVIALLFARTAEDASDVGLVISLLVTWLYIAQGESSLACGTWGKRAFHLQVLDAERGHRISFLRATGRFFARYLSMLLLMIGYLMQPFNARKRALHDFICSTVVVVERDYSRLLVALMILLGLVVPVVTVGLVAAIALPAYQTFVVRQKVAQALRPVTPATVAVQTYLTRTGQVPGSLEETGFDPHQPLPGVSALQFTPGSGVITVTLAMDPVAGSTLQIVPAHIENGRIDWACRPGSLQPQFIPDDCPPGAEE